MLIVKRKFPCHVCCTVTYKRGKSTHGKHECVSGGPHQSLFHFSSACLPHPHPLSFPSSRPWFRRKCLKLLHTLAWMRLLGFINFINVSNQRCFWVSLHWVEPPTPQPTSPPPLHSFCFNHNSPCSDNKKQKKTSISSPAHARVKGKNLQGWHVCERGEADECGHWECSTHQVSPPEFLGFISLCSPFLLHSFAAPWIRLGFSYYAETPQRTKRLCTWTKSFRCNYSVLSGFTHTQQKIWSSSSSGRRCLGYRFIRLLLAFWDFCTFRRHSVNFHYTRLIRRGFGEFVTEI